MAISTEWTIPALRELALKVSWNGALRKSQLFEDETKGRTSFVIFSEMKGNLANYLTALAAVLRTKAGGLDFSLTTFFVSRQRK